MNLNCSSPHTSFCSGKKPRYQATTYSTPQIIPPDLEHPGSKFTVPTPLIQDPAFTATDKAFLQGRGHTVVPYSGPLKAPNGHPLDPDLLLRTSDKTFFFATCLDIAVSVDVMFFRKITLSLSHDLLYDVTFPYFVRALFFIILRDTFP